MKLAPATVVLLLSATTLLDGAELARVAGRGIDATTCDGGVSARQLCVGAACKTLTIPFTSLSQSHGSLNLPAGRWELTVTSSRCWAPAVTTDASASSTLPIWPAAAIHGTVDPATGDISGTLRAELRLTGGDEQDAPRFSEDCTVANARWSCRVPATGFHFRLSLDQHAPWYARNVRMSTGEEKDFGAIRIERGASVAGTIATTRGSHEETVVELTPASPFPSSPPQKTKHRRVVVKGANGGLFQFTAVPKGAYRLTVSRPGWLPAEVKSIRVEEGRESFLEKPFQLVRAAVLDVYITPPLSAEEEPWLVRLETGGGAVNKIISESPASVSGEWRNDALRAGKYVLSVVDRHDNVLRRETVEASVDAAPQFLKIIKVHVRGVVKMGTVPFESQIEFSDVENSADITLQADAAGKFEGILPHQGRWFVQILNLAKTFYVKDVPVEVKRTSEEAVATVNVTLPGGKAKGRVTTKAGDPAKADVIVFRDGGKISGDGATLPDGSFEVEGLQPGPVTLVAVTKGSESDYVSYLVAEDDPAIAQIVMEDLTEVKCQLVAEDGSPIVGALIRYSAAGMTRRREAISDPSGQFSIRIPQDTHSLLAAVVVEGFPVTLRKLDPGSSETQLIILGTASASLHVVLRPGGGNWPLVTLDGQAFLSITAFLGLPLPDGRVGMVDDGIQVPFAPGVYTICSARGDSNCQVARVAAGHDETVFMDGAKSK